jgi:fructokinase
MISVVGEALIDVHLAGGVMRPHPGGGPFNTAVALARLDVPARFSGPISTDPLGSSIREALRAAGVAFDESVYVTAATPLAIVGAAEHADVDYRFYLRDTAFERLGDQLELVDDKTSAAFVGSLALAVDPPGAAVEEFARGASSRCSLVIDPNVRPSLMGDRPRYIQRFERLSSDAAIIKLSRTDAAWLYPELNVQTVADHLLNLGATCVVVTDGASGAAAWTANTSATTGAPAVQVIDTIGAGDAFTAGLLAWLWRAERIARHQVETLEQDDLEAALAYAAAAGAAQCTRASAWGPCRADVDELMKRIAAWPRALKEG